MRLKWTLGILLIAVLHIVICQRGGPSDNTDETFDVSAANLELVSNSVTNLAQRISLAMKDNNNAKTEIFSPVSIAGALSLLLLGAGGVTKNEIMSLMGFQNQQISFADIHRSFGKLFSELVSNEPTLQANIPWRENDKCNIPDDYDDEDVGSRGSFQQHRGTAGRPKRDTDHPADFDRYFHEIHLANGIFLDNNFDLNPQYSRAARELYGSEVDRLNFAVRPDEATKHINTWIDKNTHGKIPEIFSSAVSSSTVMVIASALYFKALWEDMFIEGATRPRDFFPNGRNSSSIKVDMMAHGGCFPFYNSPEVDASILGIPYKNNLTTMYVIKPNRSSRKALEELIAILNHSTINEMVKRMKKKTSVILFPKMHVSSTMNLKKVLKILGVRSIFNPSRSKLDGITAANSNQAASSTAATPRPTVNLPPSVPYKKKPTYYPNKLVFSRFENETTSSPDENDEDENQTTIPTTIPPTTESLPKHPKNDSSRLSKRDVSYKTPTVVKGKPEPLKSKDFFLNKRIVKPAPGKKSSRTRREARSLYVTDAIHKIDLEINERGTEGGAATAITLNRSGTSVVFRADEPFLLLIRNDQTKLPLFFGAVYDPTG